MIQDFKSNANLNDLEDKQERPLYELMDKIIEVSKFILINFHLMYQLIKPFSVFYVSIRNW